MNENKIKIGRIGGDAIGIGVTGSGNIIGKHINVSGGIQLNPQQLARLPQEYAGGLMAFSEAVNRQITANRIPASQLGPVQEEVEGLVKEVEQIKPGKPATIVEKGRITTRLASIAKGLLKILPQTAEVVAAFTPLAPFGKLIGTGVDEVLKAVREEG